ncbi:MAG: DNA repair protein RadC [Thomasclavelia sp.]|jgi:DNA repair protein RadC|nr:DNA repair protein RadC [Thomasclavelia sp.]
MKVREYPLTKRPREKALLYGFGSLSDEEVLAIILHTGSLDKSAIELSQEIIKDVDGINNLKYITINELTKYKGIKEAKAITIQASIELAKRILSTSKQEKQVIKSPIEAYKIIRNQVLFEHNERVIVLCLNSKLEIIRNRTISIGTIDGSMMCSNDIVKEALICGSNRIMIFHNHPSGNPVPSKEDIESTKKLEKISNELNIELVDHIIVGNNCFYSFKSKQIIHVED